MLASFGIGSGVQVNAISNIMNNTFDLGTVNLFGQDASVISIVVGVLVAAITAVVISEVSSQSQEFANSLYRLWLFSMFSAVLLSLA